MYFIKEIFLSTIEGEDGVPWFLHVPTNEFSHSPSPNEWMNSIIVNLESEYVLSWFIIGMDVEIGVKGGNCFIASRKVFKVIYEKVAWTKL